MVKLFLNIKMVKLKKLESSLPHLKRTTLTPHFHPFFMIYWIRSSDGGKKNLQTPHKKKKKKKKMGGDSNYV